MGAGAGADPGNVNEAMPSATAPNAIVAPMRDDLHTFTDDDEFSSIWYEMRGTAPNRRLIVSWINVGYLLSLDAFPGNVSTRVTFQAILEENGAVSFQYLEANPFNAYSSGSSATIGVEDDSGTVGVQFSNSVPGVVYPERIALRCID
jgi:hypothetical protein